MKKFLSFCALTLALIFSVQPIWAFEKDQKILNINNPSDLETFRNTVETSKKNESLLVNLNCDIDLAKIKNFKPFKYFCGTLNGNGHKLSNFKIILNPNQEIYSLFEKIEDSQIENLNLENFDIEGTNSVGALASMCKSTRLIDCNLKNSSIKGSLQVGGFFGSTNSCDIINSKIETTSIFGSKYVGGIIGKSMHTIVSSCENKDCNIQGNLEVGGFVGSGHYLKIENCKNQAKKIIGNAATGGVVGTVSSGYINYCSNNGEVKSKKILGAVVGFCENTKLINLENYFFNQSNTTLKNISLLSLGILEHPEEFSSLNLVGFLANCS